MKLKTSVILTAMILTCCLHLQANDDDRWDNRFCVPGVSFPEFPGYPFPAVQATALTKDYVVVGGSFSIPGLGIALWNRNTKSWEEVGSGVWRDSVDLNSGYSYPYVRGLYADGDSVFVWGSFNRVNGIACKGLAVLHPATKTWTVDTTLIGQILSVVRLDSDIVLSGYFFNADSTIRNMARIHNGVVTAFSAIDSTNMSLRLGVFKNALYAIPASLNGPKFYLARWDGVRWVTVLDYVELGAYKALDLRCSNRFMYVFGQFSAVRPTGSSAMKCTNLARFDGSRWTSLIDTLMYDFNTGGSPALSCACAYDGDVWISGDFTSVNGTIARGIANWSEQNAKWSSMGSGVGATPFHSHVTTLAADSDFVYCGGLMPTLGSAFVNNIGEFDRASLNWSALGKADFAAPVGETYLRSQGNVVVAVGDVEYAGQTLINNLGQWDGKKWSGIGSGIIGGAGYDYDGRIRFFYGGKGLNHYAKVGSTAYVSGTFEKIAGITCNNIAQIDSNGIECVDGGLAPSHTASQGQYFFPASITDMISHQGKLYVCGDFTTASSKPADGVAVWDGKSWTGLCTHLPIGQTSYESMHLAVDSNKSVIMSGIFGNIDAVACNGLASWNGSTWSSIGYSQSDDAASFGPVCVAQNGTIFIGGVLSTTFVKKINGVGSWDGSNWDRMGISPFDPAVTITAMACKGDLLYVAGRFDSIANIKAKNVAVWNMLTKTWSALGSGLLRSNRKEFSNANVRVNSIAFLGDTVLFTGSFSYAGNHVSQNMAAWLPVKSTDVIELSDIPNDSELHCSPNPSSSSLTIHFAHAQRERCEVRICDVMGRELMSVCDKELDGGSFETQCDVASLTNGVYVCVLRTSSGLRSTTIVVSH